MATDDKMLGTQTPMFVPVGPSYEERWAIGGKYSQISQSGKEVTIPKQKKGYTTTFGSKVIGNDEHCEWTLDVVSSGYIWCYIGILWSENWDATENEEKEKNISTGITSVLNKSTLYNHRMNVSYYSGDQPAGIYYNFGEKIGKYSTFVSFDNNALRLANGDSIKITLDTNTNKVTFVTPCSKMRNDKIFYKHRDEINCETIISNVCNIPKQVKDINYNQNTVYPKGGWRLFCCLYYSGM